MRRQANFDCEVVEVVRIFLAEEWVCVFIAQFSFADSKHISESLGLRWEPCRMDVVCHAFAPLEIEGFGETHGDFRTRASAHVDDSRHDAVEYEQRCRCGAAGTEYREATAGAACCDDEKLCLHPIFTWLSVYLEEHPADVVFASAHVGAVDRGESPRYCIGCVNRAGRRFLFGVWERDVSVEIWRYAFRACELVEVENEIAGG